MSEFVRRIVSRSATIGVRRTSWFRGSLGISWADTYQGMELRRVADLHMQSRLLAAAKFLLALRAARFAHWPKLDAIKFPTIKLTRAQLHADLPDEETHGEIPKKKSSSSTGDAIEEAHVLFGSPSINGQSLQSLIPADSVTAIMYFDGMMGAVAKVPKIVNTCDSKVESRGVRKAWRYAVSFALTSPSQRREGDPFGTTDLRTSFNLFCTVVEDAVERSLQAAQDRHVFASKEEKAKLEEEILVLEQYLESTNRLRGMVLDPQKGRQLLDFETGYVGRMVANMLPGGFELDDRD